MSESDKPLTCTCGRPHSANPEDDVQALTEVYKALTKNLDAFFDAHARPPAPGEDIIPVYMKLKGAHAAMCKYVGIVEHLMNGLIPEEAEYLLEQRERFVDHGVETVQDVDDQVDAIIDAVKRAQPVSRTESN